MLIRQTMLTVDIDSNSGFCAGVIRAIGKAEEFLGERPGSKLYSLGAIVHNDAELTRLVDKGLVTIDKDDLEDYEEEYDNIVDNYDDFESPKISAGYKIKCELVLKGEKKDKDAKCTVYMIKENGNWVVWSVSTDVPGAELDY